MPPSVVVVILNWNGAADTLECLRALTLTSSPARVLVVDNGSNDGSAAVLRQAFPGLRLLETGRNLGFAKGVNRGIAEALAEGADYVWLLNNDATPQPGALEAMVALAEQADDIGAVGSVIRDRARPDRLQCWGGGRVNVWTGRASVARRPQPLSYLSGASLLLRRAALEEVGLLDEGYFFYWEDVEFGFRLTRRGWRMAVAEDSVVHHAQSGSVGAASAMRGRYFFAGLVRFMRDHAPLPWLPTLLALAARSLIDMRRGHWSHLQGAWSGAWGEGLDKVSSPATALGEP